MSQLLLELRDGKKNFHPGEPISGAAFWKLEQPPKFVDVRLFWRTRGKGTEDLEVVASYNFPEPKAEESRPFQFTAPPEPCSFSGKLISLIWGLELIVKPGTEATHLEILISPTGQEMTLELQASTSGEPQINPDKHR